MIKVPLSWLKEYINTDLSPEEISHRLTMAGLEVDSIDPVPLKFQGVVVGEITQADPHPEADRLRVAQVTDGVDSFQVVCAAPNCRAGMKTAFARVGAQLTDDEGKVLKIKKGKLRGVESFGMLCAADELGLAGDPSGIMDLPADSKVGRDFADIYGDLVFDVALTPNLVHCANIVGVARELSALTEKEYTTPTISLKEAGTKQTSELTSITIEDEKNCPRYACRVIEGVKVGPSPDWLKRRVEAAGMRSINNIVDITNFVLLESGHPLHAFDMDLLVGGKIVVRCANEREKFTTLDNEERTLSADTLMICDAEKPVAVAGVMGGLNSEVSDNTVNVLLESAYFHPSSIRRTSKRLGIISEASRRFERGCDPNQVIPSLDRAAAMLEELAGGTVSKGALDVATRKFEPQHVTCRYSRTNSLLGTQLSVSEMEDIFQRLEFPFTWDTQDTFTIQVPTYRGDISLEVDLIEEVARIYGYENIPRKVARAAPSTMPHAPIYLFEKKARDRLIAEGLQEFLTCDLIGPSQINLMGETTAPEETLIRVLNPTSVEQSILRPSLLPGMLQIVKHNEDHQHPDVAGFEVGRIHFKVGEEYKEQTVATIVLSGQHSPQHWAGKNEETDFFDLKGVVENLLNGLHLPQPNFKHSTLPNFHPGRQASIIVNDLNCGIIGEVHPSLRRQLGIARRVFFAELNLHDLFSLQKSKPRMEPLPQFPGSDRDWTLTLTRDLPVSAVLDMIGSVPSKILKRTQVVSLYESEKLGADRKNVSINFHYRSDKKTLAQAAVDNEHERIVSTVQKELGENLI